MNENLAYHGRKVRRSGFIHFCYTRDGTGHIKMTEHSKPHKVQHLDFSYDKFTEYEFIEEFISRCISGCKHFSTFKLLK